MIKYLAELDGALLAERDTVSVLSNIISPVNTMQCTMRHTRSTHNYDNVMQAPLNFFISLNNFMKKESVGLHVEKLSMIPPCRKR